MIDGFYKVEFGTAIGFGNGIAVLSAGVVHGGDSAYYYTGSYKITGDQMTASVQVVMHSSGMQTVFGGSGATLSLQGRIAGDQIIGSATAIENPGLPMSLKMTRINA